MAAADDRNRDVVGQEVAVGEGRTWVDNPVDGALLSSPESI